jgi:hypothetical protein
MWEHSTRANECVTLYEKYEATIAREYDAGIDRMRYRSNPLSLTSGVFNAYCSWKLDSR